MNVAQTAGRADLHAHSTASDGRLAPSDVVRLAAHLGLAAIALTDHDTCDGLAEARAAARESGIGFVGGIELSSEEGERELHILGYHVDGALPELAMLLERMRNGRRERMDAMIAKLVRIGVPVDREAVWAEAGDGAPGRPHLARVLAREGHAADIRDAFTRYLVPGADAYVERPKLRPEEAVAALSAAGAVPVWAHPGAELDEQTLARLVAVGLLGLECVHPDMSAAESEACLRVAEKHGLVATGGSDFHDLGERVPLGTVTVPLATLDLLTALARPR